jgi:NitT/TauT family transport system ATP-binding protein
MQQHEAGRSAVDAERGRVVVESVTHTYGATQTVALSDAQLTVEPGEFVALVGPSGCGKTTLLNMVAGLVSPTRGQVLVGGRRAACPDDEIGYMFARDALLPWRTARRNVEFGLERRRMPSAARKQRARAMLSLVGLSDFESHFPLQLSQGMRQRVSIARTLAPDPQILLMDEPFAALDARTKLTLQSEFLRIWEESATSEGERRKTVVFVTHDLQEALLLADRVVLMVPRPGRIEGTLTVDLPRPRSTNLSEVLFSPAFRALHEELFTRLEGAIPSEPARSEDAR